jgi:sugar/nucleoside kinase (ribokinase family)
MNVRHQPAFPAEIVDTTGCGDAFHGAYIAAMLDGLDVAASMRFAAAAAALSARALGAQAGLATRAEVEALLS